MITSSMELGLLVLAIEFLIIALAIVFIGSRKRKIEVAAEIDDAEALVSKVSESEENRRTALATVFREKYRLSEEQVPTAVDEFLEREKAFYNAVSSLGGA